MPALQVRDFPQGLYDKLKLEAETEHRSLSQQTVHIIEKHFNRIPNSSQDGAPARFRLVDDEVEREAIAERRKRIFKEIESLPKINIPDDFPSPVEMIREDREAR